MKYAQPLGDANPNASYVDPNLVGGIDGSPVPAAAIEQTMREIQEVITYAGLVPSFSVLTQLRQAINILIAAGAVDSFGQKMLFVRDEKSLNTPGGTMTTGAWRTRDINTVVHNGISGSSVSSNQIILPAGTYFTLTRSPLYFTNSGSPVAGKGRIQNITDAVQVAEGASIAQAYNNGQDCLIRGRFTLAGTKNLEVQVNSAGTQATNGFGVPANLGTKEIYTEAIFWKVA